MIWSVAGSERRGVRRRGTDGRQPVVSVDIVVVAPRVIDLLLSDQVDQNARIDDVRQLDGPHTSQHSDINRLL